MYMEGMNTGELLVPDFLILTRRDLSITLKLLSGENGAQHGRDDNGNDDIVMLTIFMMTMLMMQ